MAKPRTVYACASCGAAQPKWAGRCSSCGDWNSLHEEVVTATASPVPGRHDEAQRVGDVDLEAFAPTPTGVDELDRVLGGGFVPGSVTLVGGEPGVGKSTLLLQAVQSMAAAGTTCLYVSAEESKQQVRMRAERLGALGDALWLASDTSLAAIEHHLDTVDPGVVVIDSIQTVHDGELSSAPGTVAQVRQCAHRLVSLAKQRGLVMIAVGHVTKDGGLAGPRVLEHVVDTVIELEGDRRHGLRLLRAVKHRFGSTEGLGLFEMTETGMRSVSDPSAVFLADRRPGVPGSVVVPTLDGRRPLVVELQALAAGSALPTPRRSAQGVDGGRLALLLAVLERRVGVSLASHDVYATVIGGVRVHEPGADLGLALAVVSSLTDRPVPEGTVVLGEVGLGGEIRQVANLSRRLNEAARLGFTEALVPDGASVDAPPLRLRRVAHLAELVDQLGLLNRPRAA